MLMILLLLLLLRIIKSVPSMYWLNHCLSLSYILFLCTFISSSLIDGFVTIFIYMSLEIMVSFVVFAYFLWSVIFPGYLNSFISFLFLLLLPLLYLSFFLLSLSDPFSIFSCLETQLLALIVRVQLAEPHEGHFQWQLEHKNLNIGSHPVPSEL